MLRQPVGIAVLVTPWNFPAAMATRKIGPALAAGCPVILKPASETPLTALAIGALLAELVDLSSGGLRYKVDGTAIDIRPGGRDN